ncbi:MAG: efflux RND transporter periplasmic adaptor subunit [Deltaproteobacteria bacterium]|nr:MAG: efflux RND transporter periplasmic adaptor subunit [Deltaproteobacteria bacterium]
MRRYLTGISTLIAIALLLFGSVWLGSPARREHVVHIPESLTAPMVETTHPVRRNFSVHLNWFGRVESKRSVQIRSLASGRIMAVSVGDGAPVRRGDALFTLGGPQVAYTLSHLEQRITALEKQASLAKDLVQVKRDALAERLAKREELLTAKEDLCRIEGDLLVARKKRAAFRSALLVQSPMDGIFVNRSVSPGQDVQEGAHLADVISTDLRITALLFLPAGASLDGKRAVIQMPSGAEITGAVVSVLPQRTLEGATSVWMEGKEINRTLKPGERVSGWVVLEDREDRLVVPQDAIVRDDEEHTFVFVKTTNGYEKRAVTIGIEDAREVEIVSGLSGSEDVVTQGAYELFYRDFAKTYKVAD